MLAIHSKLVLLRKREHKTQQDIAQYVGVSTAAVSKWETGQSYPDIMTLPKLANYFNISIDDLLGYESQMTKEAIQKLYQRLALDFQSKPFKEVLDEIKDIAKEYYACFPLLQQLSVLLLNYSNISHEQTDEVYEYIAKLCQRIENHSGNLKEIQLSQTIRAQLALLTNEPRNVLNILGEQIDRYAGNDILLASAYQKLGETERAAETYQISLFQNTISSIAVLTNYLHMQSKEQSQKSIDYAIELIDLFELEELHIPSCIGIYLSASHALLLQKDEDQALVMLDRYRRLIEKIKFPLTLHGNDYFDTIDDWLNRELELGQSLPRDEQTVRQSLVDSVKLNPVFASLQSNSQFKLIITTISQKLGVN